VNILSIFTWLALGALIIAIIYSAYTLAASQAAKVYNIPREADQVWQTVISQYASVILIIALAAASLYIYYMFRNPQDQPFTPFEEA
jgi:uncharacterized BrkB/YihY/UPF0761 family membrane protein